MDTTDEGRSSYLDLLISTLMEHEKNMDKLLEKLEKVSENLSTTLEETGMKAERTIITEGRPEEKDEAGTIIYMKININRPLPEVIKILESLKR